MAKAPLLKTERLRLEPFTEAFLGPRHVGWLNDPDVVRYSGQRLRAHTMESCREYLESFDTSPGLLWAIVVAEGEIGHIGNIQADIDATNNIADLAILIGEKEVWGRGYGAEAWVAACDWLLGPGGLRKVFAGTMTENKAMLSIMEKAGMVEECRRRKHFLWEGREVDVVYAALFADE